MGPKASAVHEGPRREATRKDFGGFVDECALWFGECNYVFLGESCEWIHGGWQRLSKRLQSPHAIPCSCQVKAPQRLTRFKSVCRGFPIGP